MANEMRSVIIDFSGQKMCIQEVTRYTTCDDVIEMLFYKSPKSGESDSYALFESSFGVERMLYGKESVLKVIRSWGAEKNSFSLVLRKVDNIRSNMATQSQARRKLRKIRSQNIKLFVPTAVDNNTIQANLDNLNNKTVNDKDIDNLEKRDAKERRGKLGILKRFLSDVVSQKKKQNKNIPRSHLSSRLPGDGCSTSIVDPTADKRNLSTADANYLNNLTFEQTVNVRSDNTLEDSLKRHNSYLNAAFVEGDDSFESDVDTENEHINYDDESAFEDYSDNDSVGELERNILEISDADFENVDDTDSSDNEYQFSFCDVDNTVIKCERIRNIFSQVELNSLEAENVDADMESFMKTLVISDSESDEGLCSLDSDNE